MKRPGALLLLCCVILCAFCGCTDSEATQTALNCVSLCDYTVLDIPEEEYAVSDADLSTAIRMQLGSLGLEASEISDRIAVEYFHCENASVAKQTVKQEIVETRFYEAARERILASSEILSFPESSRTYVEDIVRMQQAFAETEGLSLQAYLLAAYEMTEEEFRETALWSYADILVLKAVAEKEQYQIHPEERSKLVKSTAESVGLTSEEALEAYGDDYFDCLLYEEFLKERILSLYRSDIDKAAAL